jgi:hypothetical protein
MVTESKRSRFGDDATHTELEPVYHSSIDTSEDMSCSIGREGDLLLNTGLRNLLAARAIHVPKVPIRIVARHPKWQRFRNELCALSVEKNLYQGLTHPDLCDIPAEHPSEERVDIVSKNMTAQTGRLLDIGANFGYFCHRFEDQGFECTAVEVDLKALYFLRKLKRAESMTYRIVSQSVLEWKDLKNKEYQTVLALNIFHHFLKRKILFEKFVEVLRNLHTKEIFFEPHLSDDPKMKGAYRNFDEEEFADFVLKNSRLNTAKVIGTASDGRPIYKIC